MTETQTVQEKPKRKLKRSVILMVSIIAIAIASYMISFLFHAKEKPEMKPVKTHTQQTKIIKRNQPKVQPDDKPGERVTNTKVTDINNSPPIDNYLNGLHFNGAALVVKDNQILINKGYGYADFEKKLPNNSETVFYIGSITKVFISTVIMQLHEQGKVNINDPLSKYISDFPGGNQIKLYHLLTHTSGIPEHSETDQKISHEDLIRKIEKGRLKFAPGTAWNYSDSNYTLLAYIAEKISGEPLDAYVKKHIFEKVGMNHTGFGIAPSNELYVPNGYKLKNQNMMTTTLPDMSELFGCGDVYTTPHDMYLFDKALYNGMFFSPATLRQFLTPFKDNYAFGLYSDPGSYSDHGVLPGWNCLNSFSKKGNEYVVLLSNVQNNVKLGVANNEIFIMMKNIMLK